MLKFSHPLHVAVLKGGVSSEREVSLQSGAAVAEGLRAAGHEVVEVDVREETFQLNHRVEAVFIALHGAFGEDGRVQKHLVDKGMPYTGSGPEASRRSFDKRLSKKLFIQHDIPTPAFEVLRAGDTRTFSLPVVVKPPLQGSTIGLKRVFEEALWEDSFQQALGYCEEVLVEKFISGRELTVAVVCNEAMPIVEIVAPNDNYSYEAKYHSTETEYLVPAPLAPSVGCACQELALRVFALLGCRGMARIDFRLSDEGRFYVLELNTIPGFTTTSLLPMAAKAAGIDFPQLCDRILATACV